MLTTVFTSPIPLVNLSTSDIVSTLITLILRRVAVNPKDDLLALLVESIASLGAHVYYSDQIQDLASELVSRLVTIDTQGPLNQQKDVAEARSQAIRCLLAGLLGLMLAADNQNDCRHPLPGTSSPLSRPSQRARVSGEIWYDILGLLCDGDFAVRSDFAQSLVTYLRCEISKVDVDSARPRALNGTSTHPNSISILLFGDSATRSLHAIHAYLFLLLTSPFLGSSFRTPVPPTYPPSGDITTVGTSSITEGDHPQNGEVIDGQPSSSRRRSVDPAARSRKSSSAHLLDPVSAKVTSSCSASLSDYALVLRVLTAIHEEVPVRGLVTGVPMLVALESAAEFDETADVSTRQRAAALKEVLAHVWLSIGRVWKCTELIDRVEDVSTSRGIGCFVTCFII